MKTSRILVVRLGAMGDVLHALPAVASLKASFPDTRISWAIHPRWRVLLAGNPDIADIIEVDRRAWSSLAETIGRLRNGRFDFTIDLQGLIQSAFVARITGAGERVGFHSSQARERQAAWFYTRAIRSESGHVVDQNLDVVRAVGAIQRIATFRLPAGCSEGSLPEQGFILASPLVGWASKQWPMEHYAELTRILRDEHQLPLVVNGAPGSRSQLESMPGALVHLSSIDGLIDATRRAVAVVGVDSGPLHLAAALAKPGVAVFGPTDPHRNGPYGGTMEVLRDPSAATTYKRGDTIAESMRAITPRMVAEALARSLRARSAAGGLQTA